MSTQIDRITGLVGNLGVKAPCNCASVGALTLIGEQTVDGYACTAADNGGMGTRVLYKDDPNPVLNGVYYCNASAWQRAPDFDGQRDVATGTQIFVVAGTVNASTNWQVTTANPINVGISNITIIPFAYGPTLAVIEHVAPAKNTPAALDEFSYLDSAAAFAFVKITWANLQAAFWAVFGGLISAGTDKPAPAGADTVAISDSAAAGATKKLSLTNLASYFATLSSAGWNALTSVTATIANGLKSATTTVVVSAAAAPTVGQVLTALSGTAADWETPAAITTAPTKLPTITATVAASALTIGMSSVYLDFRSATIGSGAISTINAAPASLVVPSTATLGTVNAVQSRLVVLVINNAGTIELAVVNIAGGNDLTETGIISTTTIAGGSNTANVIYSTTGRSNVAYRVVGYVESTQATAGTWATAPSTIQGAGGNALTAMSSLGYGQTWQDVHASRTSGTTYYNTTGKPILVSVASAINGSTGASTSATVNGITVGACTISSTGGNASISFIVPASSSYVVSVTYAATVWSELR